VITPRDREVLDRRGDESTADERVVEEGEGRNPLADRPRRSEPLAERGVGVVVALLEDAA
jgi:hypothetical protein